MPCDFVNSRPSSVSSASPTAQEAAGVVAANTGHGPDATTPGTSPGVSTGEPSTASMLGPDSSGDFPMLNDPSASAAAFAFVEWTLSTNKEASVGDHHRQQLQQQQEQQRQQQQQQQLEQSFMQMPPPATPNFDSTMSGTNPFSSLGFPMTCLAAEDDDDLAMNMTDLSLLHHFTTSTAADLNPWDTNLQEWWTHEVPRVAFRYPFVMRSLLALAGLHVAHLSQQQEQQKQQNQQQQNQSPAANNSSHASTATPTEAEDFNSPMSLPSSEASARSFHIARAIEQHKLAGQTASSMLLDLNRSTSAPMYVFSVVTLIISMAMPRQTKTQTTTTRGAQTTTKTTGAAITWDGTGVVEWARLMRGVKTIAELGETWLVEGDMLWGTFQEKLLPRALEREQQQHLRDARRARQPLPGVSRMVPGAGGFGVGAGIGSTGSRRPGGTLVGGSSHHDFNFSDVGKRRSRWYLMHEPPLAQLREAVAAGMETPEEGDEFAARQLCVKALDQLQLVYSSFLDHGESVQTVRLIFSWLCQVDQRYLDNLSRHDAYSLLLFAYFGVLLHWTDRAWWLEGWGPHIVESITNILGGADAPARYREWLRWPREQIGMPPLG